jgi:hypothetical protein
VGDWVLFIHPHLEPSGDPTLLELFLDDTGVNHTLSFGSDTGISGPVDERDPDSGDLALLDRQNFQSRRTNALRRLDSTIGNADIKLRAAARKADIYRDCDAHPRASRGNSESLAS